MLTSKAIIPLTALVAGVGGYLYFTREGEASASSGGGTGGGTVEPPPPLEPGANLFMAATEDEHQENVAKMALYPPKPLVRIVFKPGKIAFHSFQEAVMQAAEEFFPNIWVMADTHNVRLGLGQDGVDTYCNEDDIGYVLAQKGPGAAAAGVNCWTPNTSNTKIRQDILAAAMVANDFNKIPNA